MNFAFDLDTREFAQAARDIIRVTKKEESATLNKYTLQALIGSGDAKGAVHLTPRATKGRIRKELGRRVGGVGQLSVSRSGKVGKKIRWLKKPAPMIFLIATKWLKKKGIAKPNRADVAAAADIILSARNKSIAYIAAGFLACGKHFGGWGANNKILEGRSATGSYGRKATPAKLATFFHNRARGSGVMGIMPLQKAINNQVASMTIYLADKLQIIADNRRGRK